MSEGLSLRWDQTLDDRVDVEARLAWNRMGTQWPLFGTLTVFGALAGSLIAWWAALLIPAVLWAFVALVVRKKNLRRLYEKRPDAVILGPVYWDVGPGGIALELPGRQLRVPWHSVLRVRLTRESLLFMVSRQRALFVPIRALQDPQRVLEQVQRWMGHPTELAAIAPPPEPEWVFDWTPSHEDHVSYVRGVGGTRPRKWVPMVLGALLMGIALIELPLMFLIEETWIGWTILVYGPLGALMFLSGLGGRTSWFVANARVRYARWLDPETWSTERLRLEISRTGLHYGNRKGSGLIAWSAVTSVLDAAENITIMVGPLVGFSIPDHQFADDTSRNQLLARVTSWQEQAPRKREVTGVRGEVVDAENPFAPPETY